MSRMTAVVGLVSLFVGLWIGAVSGSSTTHPTGGFELAVPIEGDDLVIIGKYSEALPDRGTKVVYFALRHDTTTVVKFTLPEHERQFSMHDRVLVKNNRYVYVPERS